MLSFSAHSLPAKRRYDRQLDGIRAIAVALVLITHFLVESSLLGHLGVRIFFVLSGFLITRILIDLHDEAGAGRNTALLAFYARRVLRIFPAYYLVLLIYYSLRPEDFWSAKWLVVYLSNFHYARMDNWDPWVLGHTWSLAIEEQFYAFWPLLILWMPRRHLARLCIGAIAASLLYRFWFPVTLGESLTRDLLPLASIDALAAGALMAVYRRDGRLEIAGGRSCRMFVFVLVVTLGALLWWTPVGVIGEWLRWIAIEILPLPLMYIAINGAVNGFNGPIGRMLESEPLVYIGRISYGMYLFHPLVLWGLMTWGGWLSGFVESAGPTRFLLAGAATVLVASVSSVFYEQPINRLKRFFPYSGKPTRTPRTA